LLKKSNIRETKRISIEQYLRAMVMQIVSKVEIDCMFEMCHKSKNTENPVAAGAFAPWTPALSLEPSGGLCGSHIPC